jgi:hypothetical protein
LHNPNFTVARLWSYLARAIRCESATAIRHWWGASHGTVAGLRRVLGVTPMHNDGSRRLVHAAAKAAAAAMREREFIDAEENARSERAKRLNLAQYVVPYRKQRAWLLYTKNM